MDVRVFSASSDAFLAKLERVARSGLASVHGVSWGSTSEAKS